MCLVLIQLGMSLKVVNWIMGFIQSTSFVILINEDLSLFYKASRGLHPGCPISPFLFLIVAKAPSKLIKEDSSNGLQRGILVSESKLVTHLLFVNDIFCNFFGSQRNLNVFKNILNLFCSTMGMKVNMEKSCLFLNHFT